VLALVGALVVAGCNSTASPKPTPTAGVPVFRMPYPLRSGTIAVFNVYRPGWGVAWSFHCRHDLLLTTAERVGSGMFIVAQASKVINTDYSQQVIATQDRHIEFYRHPHASDPANGQGHRWFSHIPKRCAICGSGPATIEVDVISDCLWHIKVYDGRPARVFNRSQGPPLPPLHVPKAWTG
jgi:hypothetical protein